MMTQRILIVDDEKMICKGLSSALQVICGFHGEIKTVASGEEAIKEIGHCFYDLCFLDIKLPGLSGLDVMEKINEISSETIIVIMSGSYISADMKTKIDNYASLFIEKPIDFSIVKPFLEQVNMYLNRVGELT